MASNKNQHFVPRCYLRPFTLEGDGKAINLFNLDRGRRVPSAPVKGQCSGDYFYGEDLRLEKLLQPFEGRYAERLPAMLAPDYALNEVDADFLKRFWRLQHLRTEAASLRAVQMFAQMDADLGHVGAFKTNIKEAVQAAMYTFFTTAEVVADLNVRLVRNRTTRPFITSDNPAVMTNRWHLADRRVRGVAPGLKSAGMVGFLPLSADVLCLLYDADLHAISHGRGWVDLTGELDVNAFNEHQILNAQANLYFKSWADREYVADLVEQVSKLRPESRYKIYHLVLDRVERGAKVYRKASPDEAKARKEAVIHSSLVLPVPSRWPSILRWRAGGVVFDSGTGEGYVRKARRTVGNHYNKVKVRD